MKKIDKSNFLIHVFRIGGKIGYTKFFVIFQLGNELQSYSFGEYRHSDELDTSESALIELRETLFAVLRGVEATMKGLGIEYNVTNMETVEVENTVEAYKIVKERTEA